MIVDEAKAKIIINMNGKEYLAYKKYQDEKSKLFNKKSFRILIGCIYSLRYLIMALFVYLLGRWLINTMFPTVYIPTNFGTFIYNGFIIPYLMVYGLVLMIGIAWIIHGFGFIVVKR